MSREYVVGLPVIITVEDDGTVTYEVDTSEAGEGIRESVDQSTPPGDADPEAFFRALDAEVDMDSALVDLDLEKVVVTHHVAAKQLEGLRCGKCSGNHPDDLCTEVRA